MFSASRPSRAAHAALGALGALLLAALALAIYWAGLHGGFFFDDEANILLAEGIRMERLSMDAIGAAMASGHAGFAGRPLAQLSFALNHALSGFAPFAFKATNLAIHAVNAFLVFLLAGRLLRGLTPRPTPTGTTIAAALLAAIWLLHPIQLTSVLLVVQRMTSLSALFLLAALLLHLHGRERKGRAGMACLLLAWFVCWPLSFFSKESGVLFPAFALAWELIARRAACGRLDNFARALAAAFALAAVLGVGYGLSEHGRWLWAGYEFRSFSLLERVLTEGRVLWFYLGLIVLPSLETLGLYHDDLVISRTLLAPWTTAPALAGLAGLLWLAWRLRNVAPLASFGLAWFLVGHSLESTVLPLEIAHEHRNYLPLFGILLAAAAGLLRLGEGKGSRKTFASALVGVAVVYFPLITALRSHQFGDDVRRTQVEAQHHRASARAQYEAGRMLSRVAETAPKGSPAYSFARKHFELSQDVDPTFKLGLLGLVYLDCQGGKPPARPWVDELARRLRNTPFTPGDSAIFFSLKDGQVDAAACLGRKDTDTLFAAAIENPRLSPGVRAKLHSWHADYLWLQERDLPSARDALRKSLALVPANASNRLKWAQLILLGGESAEAHRLLREIRVEALSPGERKTLDELLALSANAMR